MGGAKHFSKYQFVMIISLVCFGITVRFKHFYSTYEPLTFSYGGERCPFFLLQTNHLQSHQFPIHPGNNKQDRQSMVIMRYLAPWKNNLLKSVKTENSKG